METPKKDKPIKSPFFNLQYMGYFLAGLDEDREDIDLRDVVQKAKFYLCEERGLLMKDPVWERYQREEEILVEYYASIFSKSKDAAEAFKAKLEGLLGDDFDWLDKQIAQNRSKIEELKAGVPDESLEFDPDKE